MNMKKISLIIIIGVIFMMIFPANVFALKYGEKLGDVLNTDIKVYIDDCQIPAYAVNNKMVIIMEDLNNYGFDVNYNEKTKTLKAARNYDKKFAPIPNIADNKNKVGSIAFSYVYTNVTAYLNNKKVESFNINGSSVIYIDDLLDFGLFSWYGKTRELRLNLYSKSELWTDGYNKNGGTEFSIDKNIKFNGNYSIKIDNKNDNYAYIERTFAVEKNTQYKFSAMVKYANYQAPIETKNQKSGANIGISWSYEHSNFTSSNEWTKIEYIFDSGDKEEITLCISNGMFGLTCKGTAWFSDIKLEKNISKPTNAWNILVVIYQNVDADVYENGKITKHHKDSLSSEVTDAVKNTLKELPDSLKDISGGLMSVKKMDVFVETKPIKRISGNSINPYDDISESLDEYLKNGNYNQIAVISPLYEIAKLESGETWGGLGGTFYYDIGFCQFNASSDYVWWWTNEVFPDVGFVHEILHCLETKSRELNPETANLHGPELYGFTDDSDGYRAWYSAYMQNKLTDGNGIDPRVYSVYNDNIKYQLISGDMKVGGNILFD